MLSFQILSLSNYAYHCGSPYKAINSVEVSRIAEFCTDYCKNFLGEDTQTSIPVNTTLPGYRSDRYHEGPGFQRMVDNFKK